MFCLQKEVRFHLGFPTGLQRCRLLHPARFVSPSCKHTHTHIISSVCPVPLSQGVFPLEKLSTSYKVPGPRPGRPPRLLATSEKAPWLYRFTTISSGISTPLFSNPIFNLHLALLSQATSTTLTRIPKQYWSLALTGATAQVKFCSSDIIKLSIYICLSRNSTQKHESFLMTATPLHKNIPKVFVFSPNPLFNPIFHFWNDNSLGQLH